ncbi:MAG: cobyric acid synthase [Ardenticatenia bacterium]|nr:cobyric acid synthase [Ardenticatenia bacterium]
MTARVLMVQGTASSVGKSWLVAALCRILARRGVRVAPFKAQNMSNNAAVCPDGAEIGRAQALQARAAGLAPCAEMNPILLKPEADSRSQVVVMGHVWQTLPAGDYYRHKRALWPVVTAALDRLRARYDVVVIEGAGSPAELNLRAGDIVNMAVARYANAPVLLVGDIDRGGIFAQLLGTLWLLPPEEQALVRGLVVNKFRGDPALFDDGVRILEARSGRPVLGVMPYVPDLVLPEEDAATVPTSSGRKHVTNLDIAVVRFPRMANFDDVDPFRAEPGVRLRFVSCVADLGRPDAVILPGSKSTVADLRWLRDVGLAEAICALAEGGTAVVGLCGGYQMLGQAIYDPGHVESDEERVAGLGLLPVETTFVAQKATCQVSARLLDGPDWLTPVAGHRVQGYEIHMGRTRSPTPWLEIVRRNGRPVRVLDGAMSANGRVWGCYVHGIFANDAFRRAWMQSLRPTKTWHAPVKAESTLERALDTLAQVVETALDMSVVSALTGVQIA